MYNVEDLKSRALVESNILKQFILSMNAKKRGEFKPRLDDILIHDYQMANSVTLNVILSNYMVDLAYAVDCIENPLYGGTRDSYFKLVRGLDEKDANLDDQTRLILDVADGNGSFKTRDLVLGLTEIWNENQKVKKFINLDSIWYCKKVVDGHDTLSVVEEMNNFDKNPNPFGENPFDKELFYPNGNPMEVTFNDWLGEDGKKELNCIVENRFYKSVLEDEGAISPDVHFGQLISKCRYLLCVPDGFYGLESNWDDGLFLGFKLHDIGETQPILSSFKSKDFNYKFCSFHVIGNKDETTLFLAIQDENGAHHYLYLNESSLDETYGFTMIDSVVVDQLIVPPSDVFSKVEEVRELDTVNIALTDYGFWDIEENTTNNKTFSYRNGKRYYHDVGAFNNDTSKLVNPNIQYDCEAVQDVDGTNWRKQIAVEYCAEPGNPLELDRIWNLDADPNWYRCEGLDKSYRSYIVPNGFRLPFFGGTEHFAVYKAEGEDPIHVLVNISPSQFVNLLFANSQLTTYFIEWLYKQVVYPSRGEHYLYNNHFNTLGNNRGFIGNLGESLWNNDFEGLQFQIGKEYTGGSADTVGLPLSTKFKKIRSVVEDYDPSATTMTDFCNDLYGIVNDETQYVSNPGVLGVTWLYDNDGGQPTEEQLTDKMKELFSKITWPDAKRDSFVESTVDHLVSSFPLLAYFRDYLMEHIGHDLEVFSKAIDTSKPAYYADFVDDEKKRVVKSVQDYIRNKVRTAIVLGGYNPMIIGVNEKYPGIDQYIYQNQRKLNKVQVRDVMSLTNTLKEVMFGVQSTKFFTECESYLALQVASPDEQGDLFTMTQNAGFVALSNFVNSDGETLNLNWDSVREWLFESNPDNCSNENMLKAFVRTQIYRPLFFKHDDYVSFTSNQLAYKCETTKWFVDHDGNPPRQIVFQSGTWPDNPVVDKEASGLVDVPNVYKISNIGYFGVSNKFEYHIHYNPVKIVDNKFVVNDVEFYVVRPKEESDPADMAVNSIYFNEFQSNTEGQNQVAKVVDNRFTLDGMGYVIDGNAIYMESSEDDSTSS